MKSYLPVWLTVTGFAVFILLYVLATLLYPGGSQADAHAKGFSWLHNYWCNLLNAQAMNGEDNAARPVAIAAMLILCITISCFWLLFAQHIPMKKAAARLIRVSGITSMLATGLLLTSLNHDLAIDIACFFGLIAFSAALIVLHRNKLYKLFVFGLFNVLLIGVNNLFYYTPSLLLYLPVVQKIGFASMLCWLTCVNIFMYRQRVGQMVN